MTEKKDNYEGINTSNLEFGGWSGALALMIWSHYILLYFWYVGEFDIYFNVVYQVVLFRHVVFLL